MMQGKTTDTLEYITTNICKDDSCANAIREILNHTLDTFQWHYQTATDHQSYENASNGVNLAVLYTVQLLRNIGENSLADDVKAVLSENKKYSILTKDKVLSQAKRHMKSELFSRGMEEWRYNKNYGKDMGIAFIELCEKYPLLEVPAHFDSDFEPPY